MAVAVLEHERAVAIRDVVEVAIEGRRQVGPGREVRREQMGYVAVLARLRLVGPRAETRDRALGGLPGERQKAAALGPRLRPSRNPALVHHTYLRPSRRQD